MHELRVGALYVPTRAQWPEGAEYNFVDGGHELRLFFGAPTAAEEMAVRKGQVKVALIVEPPLIVLCWHIDGIGSWSDCPYSWHRVPADRQFLPEPAGGELRALLLIVLVDAGTGILRAMRQVTLPPELTAELHAAIVAQASRPLEPRAYDSALAQLYRRYPESRQMAAASHIHICGT